jgi:hypothetical protein
MILLNVIDLIFRRTTTTSKIRNSKFHRFVLSKANRYNVPIAYCITLTYCTYASYTNSAKTIQTKAIIQCLMIFAIALFLLVEGFLL